MIEKIRRPFVNNRICNALIIVEHEVHGVLALAEGDAAAFLQAFVQTVDRLADR